MNLGSIRTYVLITAASLFALSLALPAIVFKPSTRSNPKQDECGFAVNNNVVCHQFGFGEGMSDCQVAGTAKPNETFVDKKKILDYCRGWNEPVAAVEYGYQVLMLGALAVLIGVFAWFANPVMAVAVGLGAGGKRIAAIIVSVIAFGLALQSYAFDSMPFDESSTDPTNRDAVDYFGIGFYVWLAALALFTLYCVLKRQTAPPAAAQ